MAKRILIIEDDPGIMELLQLIFETEGYVVDSSLKGMTTTEITLLSPDIIILDIKIQGFASTGDEICAALKAIIPPCGIPVLLLSAEQNLKQLAEACLSDAHLGKPFDIDVLVDKVGKLVA